jgi:hypothetical protein
MFLEDQGRPFHRESGESGVGRLTWYFVVFFQQLFRAKFIPAFIFQSKQSCCGIRVLSDIVIIINKISLALIIKNYNRKILSVYDHNCCCIATNHACIMIRRESKQWPQNLGWRGIIIYFSSTVNIAGWCVRPIPPGLTSLQVSSQSKTYIYLMQGKMSWRKDGTAHG